MFNLSTLSGINLQTDNYFQYTSNASTFDIKRKCVLDGTQEHFFYEQKQNEILNGKGHKKRSSAELQPLLTLNLIL